MWPNARDHLATVVDLIVNWDRTRRCGASHGSSRLFEAPRNSSVSHWKLSFKQNLVFQDVPMGWTWRLGSEIVPIPAQPAACDEVAVLNPPVVWLPNDKRSNANNACTEFSKRWIRK